MRKLSMTAPGSSLPRSRRQHNFYKLVDILCRHGRARAQTGGPGERNRRPRGGDEMSHLTYPEAMVVGLIQGVTELFPVSSLGHNVLIPALIGGRCAARLNGAGDAAPQSP